MARLHRTPDQLDAIAKQLMESSSTLSEIASSIREGNLPSVLVHATLPENTHLPAIIDWVDKLKIDVRSQLRAYVTGNQSRAELQVQKNERQKLAAAKKKPGKKKSG